MTTPKKEKSLSPADEQLMCGIVMPISEIDGCSETHWREVLRIISEAVEMTEFKPDLVSNSDVSGVIQKRIIDNLYFNKIVVVDVSGKNANVMMELGMRLAFDKPVIIVKDEITGFSFDSSPIEHLIYPRDLRYSEIVTFKDRLADKISRTHEKAVSDPEYSAFLGHFGRFKVTDLKTEVVSKEDFILDEIRSLRQIVSQNINRLPSEKTNVKRYGGEWKRNSITVCFGNTNVHINQGLTRRIAVRFPDGFMRLSHTWVNGHLHFVVQLPASADANHYMDILRLEFGNEAAFVENGLDAEIRCEECLNDNI